MLPKPRLAKGHPPAGSAVDVKFKKRLARRYFVRFHMGLIVSAAAAAGFTASKLLLETGLTSLPLRYPLAVLVGYLAFLGLTRLWVARVLPFRSTRRAWDAEYLEDIIDLPESGSDAVIYGGGDSGGDGASESWETSGVISEAHAGSSGGISFPSLDIDLDEGWWILALLAALMVVLFGAGAYVIYAAPEILPDVAFNVLLASSLHKAAKRAEQQGWVRGIVRATWIPLTVVLLTTLAFALAIHRHCPAAVKLADAFTCPVAAP
ncbi:MAG TPA: hypothetical protein VMZ52_04395 [Bryobacteraceae bacterium]|nr:hypothetical protein [Bryobacteraceae bacterium]